MYERAAVHYIWNSLCWGFSKQPPIASICSNA